MVLRFITYFLIAKSMSQTAILQINQYHRKIDACQPDKKFRRFRNDAYIAFEVTWDYGQGFVVQLPYYHLEKFGELTSNFVFAPWDRRSNWYLFRWLKQVRNRFVVIMKRLFTLKEMECDRLVLCIELIEFAEFFFSGNSCLRNQGVTKFQWFPGSELGCQPGWPDNQCIWIYLLTYWSNNSLIWNPNTHSISFAIFWQLTSDFPINFPIRFHLALLSSKIYFLNFSF